jgi:hypothetical protein
LSIRIFTELQKTLLKRIYQKLTVIIHTPRIILGHRSAVITEVYAEQDQQKSMEAIVRVG